MIRLGNLIPIFLGICLIFAVFDPQSFIGARAPTNAAKTVNDTTTIRATSEVELAAAENGNFYAIAEINGERFEVIIDTGASYVTLTYADAEDAGHDPGNLRYNVKLRTANGTSKGALTKLDDVTVHGITVNNVKAVVTERGTLGITLLGMSYLSRISGFSVKDKRMTLSD